MIDFGQGVALLAIEKTDLNTLRRWRNDPRIYRWCRQNDVISEIHQEKWFQKINSDSSLKMYTITYDHSFGPGNEFPTIVGVCGLTDVDFHNGRAEFSLYIGPEYQKRGFARKALMTLFQHGFNNLGLRVIWGETFENNHAQKLFEAIGMKKEGVRRSFYFKEGRMWDAYLYSLLATEFDCSLGKVKACS